MGNAAAADVVVAVAAVVAALGLVGKLRDALATSVHVSAERKESERVESRENK